VTSIVVGVCCLALLGVARDAWVRWLADRAAERAARPDDTMGDRVASLEAAMGEGDASLPRRVTMLERARHGVRARA
jgi:hypothetical protein